MLLRWVEDILNRAYAELAARIGLEPPPLVERMIEATVLVAAADGQPDHPISAAEEREAVTLLRQVGNLERLGLRHAIADFDQLKRTLLADRQETERMLLDRLGELAEEPEQARLVLQVASAVAAVDGHVSPPERATLDRIARRMALDPAEVV